MKVKDINNYNSENFIDYFKNIYEESKFITEDAEKKRPFKNKNEIIEEFKSRLKNNDINLEIKSSISQVKEIAKLRLTELINE